MTSPAPKKGRKSIPSHLVWERREFVGLMKQGGMKVEQILAKVNELAALKGWGQVDIRTIQRDYKNYSEYYMACEGNIEYAEALREAHFDQMEKTIERLSLYIVNKKDWAPFEYAHALFNLAKIQYRYAEMQGWNWNKRKFDIRNIGRAEETFHTMRYRRKENRIVKKEKVLSDLHQKFRETMNNRNDEQSELKKDR